jgi:hypothetical protein
MAKKIRNELKDLRQFGLALAGILIIFGAVHFIRHRIVLSEWFAAAGVVALCISVVRPMALRPVYAVFIKVAHAIGWFNTKVILTLIYFALITPIAVIMRVLGNDPLNMKTDKKLSTYWVKRPVLKAAREQLEKQF